MSIFKQFTTKDVVITPFTVNKLFSFNGSEITGSNIGIDFFTGTRSTSSVFISSSASNTGISYKENKSCIYNSIKQLYYSNYLSSEYGDLATTESIVPGATPEGDRYVGPIPSPRFDNYFQSSISQSRYFPFTGDGGLVWNNVNEFWENVFEYWNGTPEEISVISIPSKIFGENIVPNTFKFEYTSSNFPLSIITDDGEGNLITGSSVVGQIFYSHGIAVLTSGGFESISSDINNITLLYGGVYGTAIYGGAPIPNLSVYGGLPYYLNLNGVSISFSSSFQIYETQYKCNIRENEYGYSLNPTLLSGSINNTYYDFATGSYFNPYVTTVGLYNNNQELVAIGKLSQPVPISKYTDTSIIISLDR